MNRSPTFQSAVRSDRTIIKRVVVTALLATVAAMAACETTEGLGKDVKKLGGNIENTADRNK